MVQQLRKLASPPEDQGLLPNALFWSPEALHAHGMHKIHSGKTPLSIKEINSAFAPGSRFVQNLLCILASFSETPSASPPSHLAVSETSWEFPQR